MGKKEEFFTEEEMKIIEKMEMEIKAKKEEVKAKKKEFTEKRIEEKKKNAIAFVEQLEKDFDIQITKETFTVFREFFKKNESEIRALLVAEQKKKEDTTKENISF